MKKVFSALMVLILLVLFAATFYCSSRTETVFKAQVEQLNQDYPGLLRVELLDYQRGLLVSEARTRIEVQRETLVLQHQIRHFPWKVQAVSRVATGTELAVKLAEQDLLEQLQLQTDIALDGAAISHFDLPELTITDGDTELQLHGLSFSANLASGMSGGVLKIQLADLAMTEANETLQLEQLQLISEFIDQGGLPIGRGELQLGSFTVKSVDGGGMELSGLNYSLATELENEQLASRLELALGSLRVGGETFSAGELKLALAGIDAAAAREIQQEARAVQADLLNPQTEPLLLQLQLFGLYSQLFQEGLSLSLERLSLQGGDGLLQGSGRFELQEMSAATGGLMSLEALTGQFHLEFEQSLFSAGFRALDNLQRSGQKSNPAVLNEQAEQLTGALLQKGFLTRRDGVYQLDVTIEQGRAALNGRPLAL